MVKKQRTVAEVLRQDFLEDFDITQAQLASAIKVHPNRINSILLGKRIVTPNTDLRLTTYFGLDEGYFLHIQEKELLQKEKEKLGDKLSQIKPYIKKNRNSFF